MQSISIVAPKKKTRKEDPIAIAKGNSKLGKIPNISLPPGITCQMRCKFCYALKFYKWKSVRKAWDKNYEFYSKYPGIYFLEIEKFLNKYKPILFRYHVGGDIVDFIYFEQMVEMARKHRSINFTVYTKKFDLLESYLQTDTIPDNLIVLLSTAPNYFPDKNLNTFRKTWITGLNDPEYDKLIPNDAFMCPSGVSSNTIHCDKCKVCYSKRDKRDVIFKLH